MSLMVVLVVSWSHERRSQIGTGDWLSRGKKYSSITVRRGISGVRRCMCRETEYGREGIREERGLPGRERKCLGRAKIFGAWLGCVVVVCLFGRMF
jgi:hypothetical protein